MKPNGTLDDREAFRVNDEMQVHYRIASQEELNRGLSETEDFPHQSTLSKFAKIDLECTPLLQKIKEQYGELVEYFYILNTKLNLLANSLLNLEKSEHEEQPQRVNISETGLAFNTKDFFPIGTLLKVQMVLLPNYHSVICFSQVVKCHTSENTEPLFNPELPYFTAVEFVLLQTMDKQIIARHIFRKQAEERRRQKPTT